MSGRELLDVEDGDTRQQRIQTLLESTDAATAATRPRRPPTLPPSRPHLVPVSDLISRAEAFLPRLAASNADLARRAALDPSSVDIEHLPEDSRNPHIEMNLGLGVFEQRPRPAHGPANRPEQLPSDSSSSDASGSEDTDSSPHESRSDDSDPSKVIPHPAEPATKPDILVLNSHSDDNDP